MSLIMNEENGRGEGISIRSNDIKSLSPNFHAETGVLNQELSDLAAKPTNFDMMDVNGRENQKRISHYPDHLNLNKNNLDDERNLSESSTNADGNDMTGAIPNFNLFNLEKLTEQLDNGAFSGDVGVSDVESSTSSPYSVSNKTIYNFMCELCAFNCNSRHSLTNHVTQVHPDAEIYKCNLCVYSTPFLSSYNRHVSRHSMERQFKCTVEGCEHACATKSGLVYHIKTHSADKPFKCSQCDYSCVLRASLIDHERAKHTNEKPFTCEYCSYKATRKTYLLKHVSKHFEERPYKCSECEYKSKQKSGLAIHIRTQHRNEKPFKCSYCDFTCSIKHNIKLHERVHTKEKPYACNLCNYRSAHRSTLTRHMIKHTMRNHECTQCEYKTDTKQDLLSHYRTTHKQKSFTCDICPYKTSSKSTLLRHIVIHSTGEADGSTLDCKLCPYKTKKNYNLFQHIRSHHKKECKFKCELCDFRTTEDDYLKEHISTHYMGHMMDDDSS